MKNRFYICALTLLLSACAVSVRDGESNYKESDLPTENELSLIDEFEEEDLDQKSLQAFEKRSVELAKDFMELVSIVNNQSVDSAMRENARRQLKSLFADSNPEIIINGSLASLSNIHEHSDSIGFISQSAFAKTNDGYYSNRLKAVNGDIPNENIEIESILRRKEKNFGDEKRMIWVVLLKKVSLNYSEL